MTSIEHASTGLALTELERACRRETQHFRQGLASDPTFCLEIFRRALAAASGGATSIECDDARDMLVRVYSDYLRTHINPIGLYAMTVEDVLQDAWRRFWQRARDGLSFAALTEALTFLKLTAVSALLEARRQQRRRQHESSLEQELDSGGERFAGGDVEVYDAHARRRLRQRCLDLIADPLDRRIFWLRYGSGYAPREIAEQLVHEGLTLRGKRPTARAISDTLERSFRSLESDQEIHDLLQSD